MSRLPRLSGKSLVKILVKKFGYAVARQTGSHVVLFKFVNGRKCSTVVPLHDVVKSGTLLEILAISKISRDEFLRSITS